MENMIKHIGLTIALVFGLSFLSYAQDNSVVIEMTNAASYQPDEIVVRKGERITWRNISDQIQTITVKTEISNDKKIAFYPDDAEPFSSGAIYPGESFSYTFFIPGSYELVSLPNEKNGMLGRIVVKD
jgi:plastocyanin